MPSSLPVPCHPFMISWELVTCSSSPEGLEKAEDADRGAAAAPEPRSIATRSSAWDLPQPSMTAQWCPVCPLPERLTRGRAGLG